MRSKEPGEDSSSPSFVPAMAPLETDDQDTGDLAGGVDEDALDADDVDTDRVTATP